MKIPYQFRLVGPELHLAAPVLGELLEALFQGNQRALRVRVEGRSVGRGPPPQWLRDAASFELLGLSVGSVVLMIEAAPLRELLPPGIANLLPPSFADQPCAALLAESLTAALSVDGDPRLYDQHLLETFISLPKLVASGFTGFDFRFQTEEPWGQAALDVVHVERLRRLQTQLASAAEHAVHLTGVLLGVDLKGRRYTLRTDDLVVVRGVVDDLLTDRLAHLFGERVTVSGRAITDRHGELVHLVTDSIQRVEEAQSSGSIQRVDEARGSEPAPRGRLARLTLHGWKTISHLPDLALGPLNVLIGANGAGKSNLLSFFKLLESLASAELSTHVTSSGGADSLLHDGAAMTPEISAELSFETEAGNVDYAFRLVSGAPDILLFAEERLRFSAPGTEARWVSLGAGHRESELPRSSEPGARALLGVLRKSVSYQFHNTSDTARIRRRWSVDDGLALKADGANLAPFLLRLRESHRDAYDRIVETVRQIAPFFADFHLEPDQGTMILQWRERNADIVFGPHQASDGMLRMMALIALLLQPQEALPMMLILDEPELGLHPYAIGLVAGLLQSISNHSELLVATQSTTFLDLFEPADVIVVDRRNRESHLKRLDPGALSAWLEEYSIGELWEKNVLGGRPAR